jgi:AcrR family transcriptional regulator
MDGQARNHSDEKLAERGLDLAEQSFIDHGFRGTKMKHLAEGAGVSVDHFVSIGHAYLRARMLRTTS